MRNNLTHTCKSLNGLHFVPQREELTEVILKLLLAWRDPLFQLHQSMAHQQDFNSFSSNKALEMGDMAHELRKGVEKVTEKVSHIKVGNKKQKCMVKKVQERSI